MRVLTFTNLYPNAQQPRHGIFVEHRTRQLASSGRVDVRVVAPVPWVPIGHRIFREYAILADVPAIDVRHGISIRHPRFAAIPTLSSWLNPLSMALGALPAIVRLRRESGDFDVIDAHFLFPDGAAAVLLGAWFRKPVVVTARGTDVNEFPRYAVPRAWIRWVARRAAAIVTVSTALRNALVRLSVPPERMTVLRNGVDLKFFKPLDRTTLRAELGWTKPVLMSVGHLIGGKGHDLVIEALVEMPDVRLLIVGDGPLRAELRALAVARGVADRVECVGTVSQATLARYYAAADATVLASKSEGMPNVLLESLACGTPVIATNVGGNAEVVTTSVAGILVPNREPTAIVRAYRELASNYPQAHDVRQHAERFAWGPTVDGAVRVFESVLC